MLVCFANPLSDSGSNTYGLQLRAAAGVLKGFDSILGRKSAHKECQLTVGCRLDGAPINALHVLRSAGDARVHSHNKFDVCHNLCLLMFLPKGFR